MRYLKDLSFGALGELRMKLWDEFNSANSFAEQVFIRKVVEKIANLQLFDKKPKFTDEQKVYLEEKYQIKIK